MSTAINNASKANLGQATTELAQPTPVFDAVLNHLRETGKLPKFGSAVEASFKVTLQSGGGCSPDVFKLSWANESMSIFGIDKAIAFGWDQHGGAGVAVKEELLGRESEVIEFLWRVADHFERVERTRVVAAVDGKSPF